MAWDSIVIGAGIVGLSTALELRRRGQRVLLVERGELGREASWAGGGILTPITPHLYPAPLVDLCRRSAELYPAFVAELEELTGVQAELRTTGLLRLSLDEFDREELSTIADQGDRSRIWKSGDEARALEASLNPEVTGALSEPGIQQVRNPRLLKALAEACRELGVELRCKTSVEAIESQGSTITGVRAGGERWYAGETIVCAGAWSGQILRSLGLDLPLRPVHGDMLLFDAPGRLSRILIHRGHYLIPRQDGLILVGSTCLETGFDKTVSADAKTELLAAAERMLPALAQRPLVTAWAGLRPASRDRLPYIGRPPNIAGLILATGHYRNGLSLAPITARVVAEICLAQPCSIDLRPFDPGRHDSVPRLS